MDINNEKYINKLPHPQLRKQKFPEPKKEEYDSYAEWGIAMDDWKYNITCYDYKRPKLMDEYRIENNRLYDLFMYDLIDDMGWSHLSDDKKIEISDYIRIECDNNKQNMYDLINDMYDLINELIK